MNLIKFSYIYVPKSTLKWTIIFIVITIIVNWIVVTIKKIKKNKKMYQD